MLQYVIIIVSKGAGQGDRKMKRYFDKVVLIKKKNRYSETRLSAYKRYINTIKPLEDLIKYIEWR